MRRPLFIGAIVLCLLPIIILGPSLWRDFSAQGRWESVAGMHVVDVSCFGRAPIFQFCGFSRNRFLVPQSTSAPWSPSMSPPRKPRTSFRAACRLVPKFHGVRSATAIS